MLWLVWKSLTELAWKGCGTEVREGDQAFGGGHQKTVEGASEAFKEGLGPET